MDIQQELNNLPGWREREGQLVKEFKRENFTDAVQFVYELAPVFEKLNHHPDIRISYDTVLFELRTHDAGGAITGKDIQTAHAIEEFVSDARGNS